MNNPKIKISLADLPAAYSKKMETLSLEPKEEKRFYHPENPSQDTYVMKENHPHIEKISSLQTKLLNKNTVQTEFLSHCVKSGFFVDIFLVNGVKLQGTITKFDSYCLVLQNEKSKMLVMKSAMSTIKEHGNV